MMTIELKCAKYFWTAVNSSRDTSCFEQLTIILRYIKIDDSEKVHESYICFEPAIDHPRKCIADAI